MLSLYCLAVLTHLAGTAMNLKKKLLTLSVALIPKRTAMSGNAANVLLASFKAVVGMLASSVAIVMDHNYSE